VVIAVMDRMRRVLRLIVIIIGYITNCCRCTHTEKEEKNCWILEIDDAMVECGAALMAAMVMVLR
jgi:hypothetical protein